jgi:lambda repressor-like predicted transcriptional regulator
MEGENKKILDFLNEVLKVKGISIEKLSILTGIHINVLENLLKGNFKKLPAKPYLHGYILKISEVLSLDGNDVWKRFLEENSFLFEEQKRENKKSKKLKLNLSGRIIIWGVVILIVFLILFFRLPYILGKPIIKLEDFKEDLITTSSPNILIKGKLVNGDKVLINGLVIDLDKDNNFQKEISLVPGLNTIKIEASKILGGKIEILKQIFYKKIGGEN